MFETTLLLGAFVIMTMLLSQLQLSTTVVAVLHVQHQPETKHDHGRWIPTHAFRFG